MPTLIYMYMFLHRVKVLDFVKVGSLFQFMLDESSETPLHLPICHTLVSSQKDNRLARSESPPYLSKVANTGNKVPAGAENIPMLDKRLER